MSSSQGSESLEQVGRRPRIVAPRATARQLLRRTLPGAVAIVLGATGEAARGSLGVDGAAMTEQMPAGLAGGLVEAELCSAIEGEGHTAQARATSAICLQAGDVHIPRRRRSARCCVAIGRVRPCLTATIVSAAGLQLRAAGFTRS